MIGDILRTERERQGLSISDIERETSIRALYIEGIENSNYSCLPSEVYVRGFIKNYANFLKLDAQAVLRQYYDECCPRKEETLEINEEPKPAARTGKRFQSGEDFRARVHKSHRLQNIAIAAGVIICAFVGSIYYFFGNDDTPQKPVAAVTEKPVKSAPAVKPAEPVKSAPAVKPAEPVKPAPAVKPAEQIKTETAAKPEEPVKSASGTGKSAEEKPVNAVENAAKTEKEPAAVRPAAPSVAEVSGPVNVGAVFTDRCWIQVVCDGKTVYEGTAEKGQSLSWSGTKKIVVLAGNAVAVSFSHNGASLGVAGKEGEVIERTFTAAGVK